MAWAKGRKGSLFTGFLLIVFSLTSIYACVRQAKSEPVASGATTKAAPKKAKAKASSPAKAVDKPLQVIVQAQPPMQVLESELVVGGGAPPDKSLTAPSPVKGLRKFEDPRNLPTPGPPYNRQNSNPNVVMRDIPKEATGVEDWVKAFKQEIVHPHESLDLNKKNSPPLKFDVEIPAMGSMPNVIFPHFPHTFWLDCTNCHPGIFMMKKGGNPISMVKIVNGEFCGRCHGRIAFPIANCTRCHVKPKEG